MLWANLCVISRNCPRTTADIGQLDGCTAGNPHQMPVRLNRSMMSFAISVFEFVFSTFWHLQTGCSKNLNSALKTQLAQNFARVGELCWHEMQHFFLNETSQAKSNHLHGNTEDTHSCTTKCFVHGLGPELSGEGGG